MMTCNGEERRQKGGVENYWSVSPKGVFLKEESRVCVCGFPKHPLRRPLLRMLNIFSVLA